MLEAHRLHAENVSLKKENRALQQEVTELRKVSLRWGWVLAKVSSKEGARLRRLASTPPRNRDNCWGGGQ